MLDCMADLEYQSVTWLGLVSSQSQAAAAAETSGSEVDGSGIIDESLDRCVLPLRQELLDQRQLCAGNGSRRQAVGNCSGRQ